MTIEYFHASKFGNGEKVANAFKRVMEEHGVEVNVHHIKDVKPAEIPAADLYVFSSPGRMGRLPMRVRHFLRHVKVPSGTRYAILNTRGAAGPDKKGHTPTEEEMAKWRHMVPIMTGILDGKGLVLVAVESIDVLNLEGPLVEGWEEKVTAFADKLI